MVQRVTDIIAPEIDSRKYANFSLFWHIFSSTSDLRKYAKSCSQHTSGLIRDIVLGAPQGCGFTLNS